MGRKTEILLEFQNYIETPPYKPDQLYGQACSNDSRTIDGWLAQWIAQVKDNHKHHGPFGNRHVGQLFEKHKYKPCIIAGAGPSLKVNGHLLKDRGDIPLVSCLHNFHFFEDQDVKVDYYVSLDAGLVTVEEVAEGGKKTSEEYWEITKDRTLLAFIGTHPELLKKWKGTVLFFNCPVPSDAYANSVKEIEEFHVYVGTGGNVLGACLYIAKAFLGCNPVITVGADFAFSYDKKFHAWDSKYDANLGLVLKAVDVYGNKVLTWQSYSNFKAWFDWVALKVPGLYINCTEGGTFGAYPEGNIMAVPQMELADCLKMYKLSDFMKEQSLNPAHNTQTLLF